MAHRTVSKLAVVAVLAAAVPAAALARDGDRDCDHRPAPVVIAPVRAPAPPAPPAPGWQHRGDWRGHEGWRREAAWRDAERSRILGELRVLDAERAAFHARVHNRWRLARYDRSYSEQRAALERRLSELNLRHVAWR